MSNWLRNLFSRRLGPQPPDSGQLLRFEGDIQALRIDLAEREQSISRLKADLERTRAETKSLVAESMRAQTERMMSDLATPAAQLLTQAWLMENEGKPVETRDVMTVARQLVQALEAAGLKPEGTIGTTVAFDPDRHQPLSVEETVKSGDQVVIRLPGMSFGGRTLRKAGVKRKGEGMKEKG
jgi:molecular chaperone GrpE (heat shock protein)